MEKWPKKIIEWFLDNATWDIGKSTMITSGVIGVANGVLSAFQSIPGPIVFIIFLFTFAGVYLVMVTIYHFYKKNIQKNLGSTLSKEDQKQVDEYNKIKIQQRESLSEFIIVFDKEFVWEKNPVGDKFFLFTFCIKNLSIFKIHLKK